MERDKLMNMGTIPYQLMIHEIYEYCRDYNNAHGAGGCTECSVTDHIIDIIEEKEAS